ncbi:MAG TPA: hypothetical protein VK988_13955 [Acidimicrobiales bacterium]|nr:hypothetical protein [Acidimicrobiales bacterium]
MQQLLRSLFTGSAADTARPYSTGLAARSDFMSGLAGEPGAVSSPAIVAGA